MKLIRAVENSAVRLKLSRDRTRQIKQGYPWMYADWFEDLPQAAPGSRALVRDREGQLIAFGMYDRNSPIAMRVVALEEQRLDDALIAQRLLRCVQRRRTYFTPEHTTGFRLINGEGDGLPGLVCDMYAKHAVVKLDGEGPTGFWDLHGIASWLTQYAGAEVVYLKNRSDADTRGEVILGEMNAAPVRFIENKLQFQADLVLGQKTGFFFDQRDNRARIGALAKDRSVLNLFGYTGGFSVYAGASGAKNVTTVDIAKPAIEEACANWELNHLPPEQHVGVAIDAFEYLEKARNEKRTWDLIIVDPPSFAPAQRHVEKATEAYQRLFVAALQAVNSGGFIALSSCSSHIAMTQFEEICGQALSKARRRATVLGLYGQPEDHPFPFACPELRYLKFLMLGLE